MHEKSISTKHGVPITRVSTLMVPAQQMEEGAVEVEAAATELCQGSLNSASILDGAAIVPSAESCCVIQMRSEVLADEKQRLWWRQLRETRPAAAPLPTHHALSCAPSQLPCRVLWTEPVAIRNDVEVEQAVASGWLTLVNLLLLSALLLPAVLAWLEQAVPCTFEPKRAWH